jgi:hypothetical protein
MSTQQQGTPSNTVQPAHFHSPQLAFTGNTNGCAAPMQFSHYHPYPVPTGFPHHPPHPPFPGPPLAPLPIQPPMPLPIPIQPRPPQPRPGKAHRSNK